jgi:hypothetical protein
VIAVKFQSPKLFKLDNLSNINDSYFGNNQDNESKEEDLDEQMQQPKSPFHIINNSNNTNINLKSINKIENHEIMGNEIASELLNIRKDVRL